MIIAVSCNAKRIAFANLFFLLRIFSDVFELTNLLVKSFLRKFCQFFGHRCDQDRQSPVGHTGNLLCIGPEISCV